MPPAAFEDIFSAASVDVVRHSTPGDGVAAGCPHMPGDDTADVDNGTTGKLDVFDPRVGPRAVAVGPCPVLQDNPVSFAFSNRPDQVISL